MNSISDEEYWVGLSPLRTSLLNTSVFKEEIMKLFTSDRAGWVKNGVPCRSTWFDIFLVGLQVLEEVPPQSK